MEYAFTDYNTVRPPSSIAFYLQVHLNGKNESEDFRNGFLEGRNRKEESILKNQIQKKRRSKENVSLEDGISFQNLGSKMNQEQNQLLLKACTTRSEQH